MATKVQEIISQTTVTDETGKVISETTNTRTKKIEKMSEPDYIKLYTDAWCGRKKNSANNRNKQSNGGQNEGRERNMIPVGYRALFLELAARMSYCDADDLEHSQIVATGLSQDEIMKALGLKHRDSLQKGLRALCSCNAIRRIRRGVYQINPRFAGKGQWIYNPRASQSSLDHLIEYYDNEKRKEEAKSRKKLNIQPKSVEEMEHEELDKWFEEHRLDGQESPQ